MSGIQDRFNSVMKSFARKEKQPDTEVVADDSNDTESHFKRVKVSNNRLLRGEWEKSHEGVIGFFISSFHPRACVACSVNNPLHELEHVNLAEILNRLPHYAIHPLT